MIVTMKKSKTRIVVQRGNENIALRTDEIVMIYRNDALVKVVDKSDVKYISHRTLSDLEEELDYKIFFRLNRKYIVNINFIRSFKSLDRVKLEVSLHPPFDKIRLTVSQETAPLFKKWIHDEV